VTWILIKLGIRVAVFGLVFGLVSWKDPRVAVRPRYALPLVAVVFALLNTALYWLLKPTLNLATMGSLGLVMPFLLNGVFLYTTKRLLRPLQIEGMWPMVKLAGVLTLAHGLLWVALDYIHW
jgi:uncharacterized membrane protein YvlD (DUF360 family)